MLQDAVLYVQRTHIFIDTCSLLSEYSEAFWNRWIPHTSEKRAESDYHPVGAERTDAAQR